MGFVEKISKTRNYRIFCLSMILLGASAGILSRNSSKLPTILEDYGGDTMWAFSAYFLIRFFIIRKSGRLILLISFALSALTELSQLYQAPWLNELRNYHVIRLMIGTGFLWSDFICYLTGVLLAFFLDWSYRRAAGIESNPEANH